MLRHRFAQDLDGQYRAGEIQTDDAFECSARHIEKGKVAEDGGVGPVASGAVDQDVHGSPFVEQFLSRCLQTVFIEDVCGQGNRIMAGRRDLAGQLVCFGLPPPQDGHACAGRGQTTGHRSSQDSCAAGDNGNLPVQRKLFP